MQRPDMSKRKFIFLLHICAISHVKFWEKIFLRFSPRENARLNVKLLTVCTQDFGCKSILESFLDPDILPQNVCLALARVFYILSGMMQCLRLFHFVVMIMLCQLVMHLLRVLHLMPFSQRKKWLNTALSWHSSSVLVKGQYSFLWY